MAANDIITLVEAKQEIGGISSTLDDTLLAAYVTAVSTHIDSLVGPVVQRTITGEQHDTNGQPTVTLRFAPVASITAVTEYTAGGTALTVTADSATVKNANGCWLNTSNPQNATLTRRLGGWPGLWPVGGLVEVTYVAGRYASTTAVSQLFKHAARLAVATNWSIQQGTGSVTWGSPDGAGMSSGLPIVMPRAVEAMLRTEMRIGGIA